MFCKGFLYLHGENEFFCLADEGTVPAEEIIARQLLGNGAAALCPGACPDQFDGSAQDALVVEAGMLEKAVIFGGQKCLHHNIGNIVESHGCAALFAHLLHQAAVPGIDSQRNL